MKCVVLVTSVLFQVITNYSWTELKYLYKGIFIGNFWSSKTRSKYNKLLWVTNFQEVIEIWSERSNRMRPHLFIKKKILPIPYHTQTKKKQSKKSRRFDADTAIWIYVGSYTNNLLIQTFFLCLIVANLMDFVFVLSSSSLFCSNRAYTNVYHVYTMLYRFIQDFFKAIVEL